MLATPPDGNLHLLVSSGTDTIGVVPMYLKTTQGEYVFDYAWADAWQRAGGYYYPKLQISVPFTPASGPRSMRSAQFRAPTVTGAPPTSGATDQGIVIAHDLYDGKPMATRWATRFAAAHGSTIPLA